MSNSKIERVQGRACVLHGNDIDTDRIIPARFMKVVTFDGLGEHAFADDRKQAKGDHPLDREAFQGAQILIVGKNFGCGSSREHAPQALMRWGFHAFVGESFAEIFAGNCAALGVPLLVLSHADNTRLMDSVEADPAQQVTLDVARATLRYRDGEIQGKIAPGMQRQLLDGSWDGVAVLQTAGAAIEKTANALPYASNYAK